MASADTGLGGCTRVGVLHSRRWVHVNERFYHLDSTGAVLRGCVRVCRTRGWATDAAA